MNKEKIIFGLGCFWGAQKWFDLVPGVVETTVGYANSNIKKPSYEQVCNGESTAVEVVEVTYDSEILPLEKLIGKFLEVVNPYTLNQQGEDKGIQYRSGIYYINNDEKEVANKSLKKLQEKDTAKKVVIEIKNLENYYLAEEHHQKYLDKNPKGYCHIKFD